MRRNRARRLTVNLGNVLCSKQGAFDLPSILVGVVVVGILTAGVLASIFGVIPLSQDSGAKQDLSSVNTAQGVSKAKDGKFSDSTGLQSKTYLPASPRVATDVGANGSCFVGVSKSGSGKLFYNTNSSTNAQELSSNTVPGCLSADGVDCLVAFVQGGGPCFKNLSWTSQIVNAPSLRYSLVASDDGTKLITGQYNPAGHIFTSTDSGATWTDRSGAGNDNWYGFASSADGSKLVASGTTTGVWTSTDSGASWVHRTGLPARGYALTSSKDGTKLLAAGNGSSTLYTSTDSGATWTPQSIAGVTNWFGVASSDDGTKLVAVDNGGGYIWTSADSGATWTKRTAPGAGGWRRPASSADGTHLTVPMYGGYIWTSSDSGQTWTKQTGAGIGNWFGAASSADGKRLIAGSDSNPFTSTDSGVTWTKRTDTGVATWFSVASSADGTKVFAGQYGTGGIIYKGVYGQ